MATGAWSESTFCANNSHTDSRIPRDVSKDQSTYHASPSSGVRGPVTIDFNVNNLRFLLVLEEPFKFCVGMEVARHVTLALRRHAT